MCCTVRPSVVAKVWIIPLSSLCQDTRNEGNFRQIPSDMFLTLTLLTWRIWWTPTNASKWQMKFNSAFKGLTSYFSHGGLRMWRESAFGPTHNGHNLFTSRPRCLENSLFSIVLWFLYVIRCCTKNLFSGVLFVICLCFIVPVVIQKKTSLKNSHDSQR